MHVVVAAADDDYGLAAARLLAGAGDRGVDIANTSIRQSFSHCNGLIRIAGRCVHEQSASRQTLAKLIHDFFDDLRVR